ncbi:hypothetical protein E2C01_015640 [Portunus trituberculatus]|uniref:Uncharacterized protein n=1 Tax=Portunus trituberculatus TaxID=210409 RepID=A0A5B7DM41_PORTR|nr:hypothetical protein [Portunus trituberculatus]
MSIYYALTGAYQGRPTKRAVREGTETPAAPQSTQSPEQPPVKSGPPWYNWRRRRATLGLVLAGWSLPGPGRSWPGRGAPGTSRSVQVLITGRGSVRSRLA